MEYKVLAEDERVSIEIHDKTEGWLPLFGANARGDFIAMPTCWPFDSRSDPAHAACPNILMLDMDLLLCRKTLDEIRGIAGRETVYSLPGVTFMAQLSDKEGNVLQVVPGQGYQYKERPAYSVLTNFSPFKGNRETHPWMGWDRYHKAVETLERAKDGFDVPDCFALLKETAQEACPTVVSMVFDVSEKTVYWCENRRWSQVEKKRLHSSAVKS